MAEEEKNTKLRIKSFEDLIFKPHPMAIEAEKSKLPCMDPLRWTKQAIMKFDNGFSISVVLGKIFLSNGKDTYEVCVFLENYSVQLRSIINSPDFDRCFVFRDLLTDLYNDKGKSVVGNCTADQISKIMGFVQRFPDITKEVVKINKLR